MLGLTSNMIRIRMTWVLGGSPPGTSFRICGGWDATSSRYLPESRWARHTALHRTGTPFRPSPDRFAFLPLRGARPGKHALRHRKADRRDYVPLMMRWNTEKVEG